VWATHPDSVKRVRPPKTTMPKTLAALPSSQYATPLELVLGKLLLAFSAVFSATLSSVALDWAIFLVVPIVRTRATRWMGDGVDATAATLAAVRGAWRGHWLQTKSLEDALRAILPSPGAAEAIGVGGSL
jgi:hypothetical protein